MAKEEFSSSIPRAAIRNVAQKSVMIAIKWSRYGAKRMRKRGRFNEQGSGRNSGKDGKH